MQHNRADDQPEAAGGRASTINHGRPWTAPISPGRLGATVTAITASKAGHAVPGGSVSAAGTPSQAPISVVERISLILETFIGTPPLTLVEVTKRTGLPRSSVHRLLEQLTATGWLAREEQTYELGTKAYEIGRSAFNQNRLLQQAAPVMRRLAQSVGFTVHLGMIDGGDVLYLASVPGQHSPAMTTVIGTRAPAYLTAVGKAVIANYPEDRRAEMRSTPLRRNTPHSIGTHAQLDAELARIRDQRVAYDRQEFAVGISCVAVSLGPPDHYYGNRAAISVFGSSDRIDLAKLAGPLRIAAVEIWDRCTASHLPTHQFENWRPRTSDFRSA